ncbi:PREDICTED: nuclear RNA export factor 2-like [Miniopterus natalensis]|uniref:nuclear RNA export factor 2-like n=1 Tax=Miniopterus natalensis TaxID=291302 RepID=UPI0007A6A626|nr:PREDICTED: nuclear RNA export factor 2-like [Miniopterus natalensis]
MRGVQKYQLRHTPYTMGQNKRRVQWHNEGRLRVTLWTNRKHLRSEMGENTQDQTLGSWFKVTVPFGRKYDKTWLMESIQRHCTVPFTPVDFHYVKKRVGFFVQDASAASALKDVSYKICDDENRKIPVYVNSSAVPYSVRDKLEPEKMEKLKLAMSKRYDISQKALDLQLLRYDSDLVGHDVDIILNRRNCMTATLEIIKKNFPELLSLNLHNNRLCQLDGLSDITQMAPTVKILNLSKNELKSTWELSKIKGLNAIRKCFPKLLRLENCEGSDVLKTQVQHFLQQYYLIYDSGDRQSLLGAYHNEACFSLTIPFIPDDPAPSSLFEYFKDNRNMKNPKDPNLNFQLLKHTNHDIVSSLCVLPKTQHDLSSFVVDMWFQLENLLFFCVNGVFKEVEGRSQGSVRAFTRTFIATLASSSSLCIMNDELFVRDATPDKTQSAFSTQVPTPSSSTGTILSQEQQEMEVSSTLSEMSL